MTKGMVVAPQPEAAETGLDILRDGGNVVDAAVGAALVQTAVDPQMCGIAGMLRTDGQTVEPEEIESMVAQIRHRGPDGRGVWVDGPIGLGHFEGVDAIC